MYLLKNILIIYVIIICWFLFSLIRKTKDLIVYNNGQVILQIITVLSFFFFFVVGLRILNIFRENKIFNLKNVVLGQSFFSIILIIVFLISIRKLIIYIFKTSWFKLHYVMMCQNNFKFYEKYRKVYFVCIYSPAFYSFKYLVNLNYIVVIGLIVFFFYDLISNDLVLDYSLWYLKYYSLFRLVYMCCNFIITKQDLLLDYYSYNIMYPGVIETNLFFIFEDPVHKMLIDESEKYRSSVLLEKTKYEPKIFGSTEEMAFFKELSK